MKRRPTLVGMAIAIPTIILTYVCDTSAQPDTIWVREDRNVGLYVEIIQTLEGGFAIGTDGWAGNPRRGDTDFRLAKLDSEVNLEWDRFYDFSPPGSHWGEQVYSIKQFPDSGYVLVGNGGGVGIVLRTDAEGELVWFDTLRFVDGGNIWRDCVVTEDDEIVCAAGGVVIKYSADGEVVWRRGINALLFSVSIAPDGGFMSSGRQGGSLYAVKLNNEGRIIWERTYGSRDYSEGSSVAIPTTDGGWCFGGAAQGGNRINYAYVVKTDADGNMLWDHRYDVLDSDCYDGVETADGGFAFGGNWDSGYYMLRIDYFGEMLWEIAFGGAREFGDLCNTILLLADGGYLLSGATFLVRTEPDPVDLPFELEPLAERYNFGRVSVDSIEAGEIALHNFGRRYVFIDSIAFAGDASAFAVEMEYPYRINPADTAFIPVFFSPDSARAYAAILTFFFGDSQAVEVGLNGQGRPLSIQTGVERPVEFKICQPYPNPFNSTAVISFSLPVSSPVSIKAFDLTGREVKTLTQGFLSAGEHRVVWNAGGIGAGSYLLKMEAPGRIEVSKVLVMK